LLKAQEKAIAEAKSDGMSEEIIAFLTTESMQAWQYDVSRQIVLANPDFTIEELRRIYVSYDPRNDDDRHRGLLLICSLNCSKILRDALLRFPNLDCTARIAALYKEEAFVLDMARSIEQMEDIFDAYTIVSKLEIVDETSRLKLKEFLEAYIKEGLRYDDRIPFKDLVRAAEKFPLTSYRHVLSDQSAFYTFLMEKSLLCKTLREVLLKGDEEWEKSTIDYQKLQSLFPLCSGYDYQINQATELLSLVQKKTSISLYLRKYSKIRIDAKEREPKEAMRGIYATHRIHLVIFWNDQVYEKTKAGRLVPLSIKRFKIIMNQYPAFEEEFFSLLDALSEASFFAKGVTYYIKAQPMTFLPMTVQDSLVCGSWKEYFLSHYHKAGSLPLRISEHYPDYIYLLIKVVSRIREADRTRLYQMKKQEEERVVLKFFHTVVQRESYPGSSAKRLSDQFLRFLMMESLPAKEDIGRQREELSHYLKLAKTTKEKVSISFRSMQTLQTEIRRMSLKVQSKDIPTIRIPRNSVFKGLRKLLPRSFERIQTRKRIIEESLSLRNDAMFYAELMNKDRCAVYSYVLQRKRYTFVFSKTNEGYELSLAEGMDQGLCPISILQYIKKLLKSP
jgi:hypothetical protein